MILGIAKGKKKKKKNAKKTRVTDRKFFRSKETTIYYYVRRVFSICLFYSLFSFFCLVYFCFILFLLLFSYRTARSTQLYLLIYFLPVKSELLRFN